MPEDPRSYSALLYATLHDLDALGVQCIVVDEPPAEEAWAAVRDRLRRAAQSPSAFNLRLASQAATTNLQRMTCRLFA